MTKTKQDNPPLAAYDLGSRGGQEALGGKDCEGITSVLDDCHVTDWVRTGKPSRLRQRLRPVFSTDEKHGDKWAIQKWVVADDCLLYKVSSAICFFDVPKNLRGHACAAVVLPESAPRRGASKKLWRQVLVNADSPSGNDDLLTSNGTLVDELHGCDVPVVSFYCLARLFLARAGKLTAAYKVVLDKLSSETLTLLDYTLDEEIPFTGAEKKASAGGSLKPPKPGFSPILAFHRKYWHRAGSCLFRDDAGRHYLLGQDEGTYFGCELPEAADTVVKAFATLVPPPVRRQPYVRQGEWFAVPVDERELPERTLEFFRVTLPRESLDSNRHDVECFDGFLGKDGQVYVCDAHISHEQHTELKLSNWHVFYRNTAVRSVSEEGVD